MTRLGLRFLVPGLLLALYGCGDSGNEDSSSSTAGTPGIGGGGASNTGGSGTSGSSTTGGAVGSSTGGSNTGGSEPGGASSTGGSATGGSDPTGGTAGTATGGTAGTATGGTAGSATGGTAGSATGGTAGTATGGTAGTATGGTGGGDQRCALNLADQFELVEFPLAVNAQQDQGTPVIVTPDNAGGLWVAWTDSPWSENVLNAHVRHVNGSLQMEGGSLDLPGSIVLGMYAHDDGTLAIAHGMRTGPDHPDSNWGGAPGGVAPNTLFLSKYDGATEVFRTKLRGGDGYGTDPETTWLLSDGTGASVPLAFDGRRYGLLYVIGKHFADDSVHQADEYIEVAADGTANEQSRSTWINSHSFWPSTVAVGGSMYTLTCADPFPVWGLRLGEYPTSGASTFSTVWPTSDIAGQVPSGGVIARQGAMFEVAGRLAVAFRTWVDPANPAAPRGDTLRAAYLAFETDGSPSAFTHLAWGTGTESSLVVAGARFGADVVALVGEGPNGSVFGHAPIKAQVLAPDGTDLTGAIDLNARISWSSDPVTLQDGSVVWPAVKDNVSTTLQLARISCN